MGYSCEILMHQAVAETESRKSKTAHEHAEKFTDDVLYLLLFRSFSFLQELGRRDIFAKFPGHLQKGRLDHVRPQYRSDDVGQFNQAIIPAISIV